MSTEFKKPTETVPSSLLAPEEPILRKYSRHHEFPLSTLISIVTHCLVALIGFLAGAFVFGTVSDRPLPFIGPIVVVDDQEGGGGKRGDDENTRLKEPQVIELERPALIPEGQPPLFFGNDPADEKARIENLKKLEKTQGIPAADGSKLSKGDGGGDEGVKGTGKGPKSGSGTGNRPISKRAIRMDRWILSITYANGMDYLNKLDNLQAVVAMPEGAGQFRVFMDLSNRPFQGQLKTSADLSKLNRIYWTQSDSVVLKELAKNLDLASPPSLAYVFFPRALEDELLAKELAHAGLTEEQIIEKKLETKFRAERQGDKWLVTVLEQKPRK